MADYGYDRHPYPWFGPTLKFFFDFPILRKQTHTSGVHMRTQIVTLTLFCLCAAPPALRAQEFRLWNRNVQVHGFASQGFVYTDQNNWLTMKTSQGSAAFTDFGANIGRDQR